MSGSSTSECYIVRHLLLTKQYSLVSSIKHVLLLLCLLWSLSSPCCAQQTFTPTAMLRGWDILSFTVDHRAQLVYVIDGGSWVRAFNLTSGMPLETNFYSSPDSVPRLTQITSFAVSPQSIVYCLLTTGVYPSWGTVLTLNGVSLQPRSNFSLLAIALLVDGGRFGPLGAGPDGLLYVRSQNSSNQQMSLLDSTGAIVDWWTVPIAYDRNLFARRLRRLLPNAQHVQ